MSCKRSLNILLHAILLPCVLQYHTRASDLYNYDLASLYYEAEVVVEVEEGEYKTENYMEVGEATVLKVYKGTVAVGDKLKVGFSAYRRISMDAEFVQTVKPAPLKSKKALLFLMHDKKLNLYWPWADGARLIGQDGVVYGFQQFSNPGPYYLIKDSPDYLQMKEKGSYDEAKLHDELELAIKRAESFERALAGTDPEALRPFLTPPKLKKPVRMESVTKACSFGEKAALRLNRIAPPAMLFSLLLDAKNLDLDYNTRIQFHLGFRSREALDFLFDTLNNPTATEAEHLLAADLAARPEVVWDHVQGAADATAAARKFQLQIVQRALSLLLNAKTTSQKRAAARLFYQWHPDKPTPRPADKPVPLTDASMVDFSKAITAEQDSATKLELSRWYCRLGGLPAYAATLSSKRGLLVFPTGHLYQGIPELRYDVYTGDFWTALQSRPHLSATSLDEGNKEYLAEANEERDTSDLDLLRKQMSGSFDNRWMATDIKNLPPGRYAFRLVFNLLEDNKPVIWRSEPV